MAERDYYWQRAVTLALQNHVKSRSDFYDSNHIVTSRQLEMGAETQQEIVEYIMRQSGESENTSAGTLRVFAKSAVSEKASRQKRRIRVLYPSLVFIGLGAVLVLWGMRNALPLLGAIVLLTSLIVYLRGEPERSARRIWRDRGSVSAALDSMCEQLGKSRFQAASKPVVICLAAGILAMAGLQIAQLHPENYVGSGKKASELLNAASGIRYDTVDNTSALLSDENGALLEDAQQTIQNTWDRAGDNHNIRLCLAATAARLTETGLDRDFAADLVNQALLEAEYKTVKQFAFVKEAISSGLCRDPEAVLDRLLKTLDIQRLSYSDGQNVSKIAGMLFRGASSEEILERAGKVKKKHLYESEFISGALESMEPREAAAMLAGADEEGRQQFAEPLRKLFSTTDEILSFLKAAAEAGVRLGDCYPDGVPLKISLAHLPSGENGKPGTGGLLVVRHTESTLQTWWLGDGTVQTGSDETLSSDSGPDLTDAANYTVRLDTKLMDRVPPELLPASMDECAALLVLDTEYARSGSIRSENKIQKESGAAVDPIIIEEATFDCIDRVFLCDWPACAEIRSFGEHVNPAPDKDISRTWLENAPSISDILKRDEENALAQSDPDWLAETGSSALDAIEADSWKTAEPGN